MRLEALGSFEVKPREDFDFQLTASAYTFSWQFDGKNYFAASWFEEDVAAARLRMRESELEVAVYSAHETFEAKDYVNSLLRAFGCFEELRSFYSLLADDPVLSAVLKSYKGMRLRSPLSLWESTVIAVLNQNVDFLRAWKNIGTLFKLLGAEVEIEGRRVFLFPSPSEVLGKRDHLAKCPIGYRAQTLLRLADTFRSAESRELLLDVKGVGHYSRSLALLLWERDYSQFPVDRWFRRIVPPLYFGEERTLSPKEADELAAELWGDYRGLAYYFLTIVLSALRTSEVIRRVRAGEKPPFVQEPSPLTLYKHV